MTGYTKLFSSIITSSIWMEDDQTRITWITMLAIADRNGEVMASVPGLARLAGIPIAACQRALDKFLAQDPHSRTPDDGGRRIEPIDGGWALLNHAKYRAMASREESQSASAERSARYRDRLKRNSVTPVTVRHAPVTPDVYIAEAEAKAEAELGEESPKPPLVRGKAVCYPPEARVALFYLNEKSHRQFRETAENLGRITARLKEPGVTIEGVKTMIERQCQKWLNTEQADYLRPETLFGPQKFDGYYAAKDQPIPVHVDPKEAADKAHKLKQILKSIR